MFHSKAEFLFWMGVLDWLGWSLNQTKCTTEYVVPQIKFPSMELPKLLDSSSDLISNLTFKRKGSIKHRLFVVKKKTIFARHLHVYLSLACGVHRKYYIHVVSEKYELNTTRFIFGQFDFVSETKCHNHWSTRAFFCCFCCLFFLLRQPLTKIEIQNVKAEGKLISEYFTQQRWCWCSRKSLAEPLLCKTPSF